MVKTQTQTHNLYKYNNKLRVGQNTLFNTQDLCLSMSVGVCVDNDTADRWTDMVFFYREAFYGSRVELCPFKSKMSFTISF